MSSRAAFSAPATVCASMCSWSTPKPAVISGPSGSTSPRRSLRYAGRNRRAPGEGALTRSCRPPRLDERSRRRTPDSMDLYFQGAGVGSAKGLIPDKCRASARLFRSRAHSRSRQCRRADSGRRRRTQSPAQVPSCGQSHGGLRGGRSEIDQGLVPRSAECGALMCASALSKSTPTAPRKASGKANRRWSSTEICSARTDTSVMPRFLSERRMIRRRTFWRRCASVLAICTFTCGIGRGDGEVHTWATRRRRCRGCGDRSKSIAILRIRISFLRPSLPASEGPKKPAPRVWPDWRSTQLSRCRAPAPLDANEPQYDLSGTA